MLFVLWWRREGIHVSQVQRNYIDSTSEHSIAVKNDNNVGNVKIVVTVKNVKIVITVKNVENLYNPKNFKSRNCQNPSKYQKMSNMH